ncbi:hypothetical protein J1614_012267 [Plenodomus biglobosus]|nr:hypothetical protein J1614_012267 [Plenodomus biglobosus]
MKIGCLLKGTIKSKSWCSLVEGSRCFETVTLSVAVIAEQGSDELESKLSLSKSLDHDKRSIADRSLPSWCGHERRLPSLEAFAMASHYRSAKPEAAAAVLRASHDSEIHRLVPDVDNIRMKSQGYNAPRDSVRPNWPTDALPNGLTGTVLEALSSEGSSIVSMLHAMCIVFGCE